MAARESQMFDGLPWIGGYVDDVPDEGKERLAWLAKTRAVSITPEEKESLEKWYRKDVARMVTHAEAFEIREYGRQPDKEEIRQLFPMLKQIQ